MKVHQGKALALVALLSFLLSIMFLNRWVITDQGLYSFGRLWHYYISYFDFGFTRRALLGTILTESGVNGLLDSAYLFAYVFYAIKISLLVYLVYAFSKKHKPFPNAFYYIPVFLSPAFILQSSYITGSQDILLLIIAALLILFCRNWILFLTGSVMGVLMHELFLFMFPFIGLVYYSKSRLAGMTQKGIYTRLLLIATPVLITGMVVLLLGQADIDQTEYEALMAERTPESAFLSGSGSGYFEIASTVDQNLLEGDHTFNRVMDSLPYMAVPLLYLLILTSMLAFSMQRVSMAFRVAVFVFCLLPLAVTFLAADVYRWIGMSANLAILGMLYYGSVTMLCVPRKGLVVLMAFTLLAPFGGPDIHRPFPAHQLLLERIT